jgi:hypothetical protein
MIKGHLPFLLSQIVFPSLCLSVQDIELFTDDPTEFVRKIQSPIEDWLDPRNAAISLLQSLARYRQKDTLPIFFPFLTQVMATFNSTPVETRDYRQMDGAIVGVSTLAKIIWESKTYV